MALIIDTDIGSDGDDAIAVAYAIAQGVDVKLITTVHGDTTLRAKIAKKLTLEMGVDIPVAAGEYVPLKQKQIFSTGHEGQNYIGIHEKFEISNNAVDVMADVLHTYAHTCIYALGPLTNIARLLERHPGIEKRIGHVYSMGNAVLRDSEFLLNYRAHNFKVDPEAVDAVVASKIPMTIVTTEVAKKNYFTKQDFEELAATGHKALHYIRDASLQMMAFINYDVGYLYDPLVVEHALDQYCTVKRMYGQVGVTIDTKYDVKPKILNSLKTFCTREGEHDSR